MKRLTLSNMLSVGAILLSMIGCYYSLEKRVSLLENNQQIYVQSTNEQLTSIKSQVNKLVDVLIDRRST